MDPVDVLITPVHVAQLIRAGKGPEKVLARAYKSLKLTRPDLWIERLLYFPEKKLIYPHVGS